MTAEGGGSSANTEKCHGDFSCAPSLVQAAIHKTQFGQLSEGGFPRMKPRAHPDVQVILIDTF